MKLSSLLSFVFFFSGFAALIYQVVWQRLLTIHYSVGSISITLIVSVYMFGMGIGSLFGGFLSERGRNKIALRHPNTNKRNLFFIFQFLIGLSVLVIIAGYYYLTQYTPFSLFTKESFLVNLHPSFYVPNFNPVITFARDIYTIVDMFIWPFFFMFVPTFLMGASFPLITSLALSQRDKEGKTVGTVYSFNISGNVLGGIVTSFILFPYMGTENTMLGFSVIGIMAGLFVTRLSNNSLRITKKNGRGLYLITSYHFVVPPKRPTVRGNAYFCRE